MPACAPAPRRRPRHTRHKRLPHHVGIAIDRIADGNRRHIIRDRFDHAGKIQPWNKRERKVDHALQVAGAGAAINRVERGGVALLGLNGNKAQLIFVRGNGLPFDLGLLLRESVALVGGRGGERPVLAKGGGPETGRLAEAIQYARRRMASG